MIKSRKIGIVLSYIYFVINTIISVFLSSFLIKSVGKADYGVYQSVAAFIGYLTLLEFGTGRIISRNIALLKKDGEDDLEIKKNISTILVINLALTLIILCVAVCFWLSLDVIYANSMTKSQIEMAKKLFLFPIITLVVSFFQQMLNGILIGYENYTFENLVSIIKVIVRASLIVLAFTIKKSIFVFAIIDTSINVFVLIVTLIYVLVRIKAPFSLIHFDKTIFKLILPLFLAMLLQSVVSTVNNTVDKFLISIMMTPEDVTVYSIAMTIYTMFSTIGSIPSGMYLPKVAKDMKDGKEGRELTTTLITPCRLNALITGIIGFGFAIAGKQFITILYGLDCVESWILAIVIIVPTYFNVFNNVILNVLDVLRKRHVRSIILMATTCFNLISTIIGIKYFGMLGAAIATGVATFLQVVILNIYYHKYINIDVLYLFRKGLKGIFPSLVLAFCVALPFLILIENVWASFFVCGLTFLCCFGVCFYAFGSEKGEKQFINRIVKKIFIGKKGEL